jgi:hypothetical protein
MPAHTELHISIPQDPAGRDDALTKLRVGLAELPSTGTAEIWVDHGPFPAMCALLNGDKGWLMWLRFEGDAGFISLNPEYHGPSNAQIEYVVGQGQVDRYPSEWAYPRTAIVSALRSFAQRRLVEGVSWSNRSGDGATTP